MAEKRTILGPFPKGLIRRANHLDFPQDALWDVENVDLSTGLSTRDGCSLVSDGSLPVGTVLAIKQGRYPTPEKSKVIVQDEYLADAILTESADGPYLFDHAAIWDAPRSRMLVFAGANSEAATCYHEKNALYSYTLSTDTWATLAPTGGPPAVRAGHTAIYDTTGQRMIVFGGITADGMTHLNDVWALDLATLVWSELTCTGTAPSARFEHVAVYRSSNNSMVVAGGYDGSDKLAVSTIYSLNLSTLVWSTTAGSGVSLPVARQSSAAVYHATSDTMYIMGGIDATDEWLADYWSTTFTGAWTELTGIDALIDPTNTGTYQHAAVIYGSKVLSCFGWGNDVDGGFRNLFLNDTTWSIRSSAIDPVTSDPGYIRGHVAVVTGDGTVIVHGGTGYGGIGPLNDLHGTWVGTGLFTEALSCGLYASDDLLPTTSATFESIYDLGAGAGTANIAQLNDRVIITEGVNEPPLVFPGAMSNDASDWAVPIGALARPNGVDAYDISAQVCDKDIDTVADVGNWIATGDMLVRLDVPKTSGLYVQVGTANTGIPDSEQVFYEKITFSEYSEINRHDVSATITNWVQSAGATGQFTDGAAAVTIGPTYTNPHVVKGSQVIIGGVTRYIMAITNGGAGAAEVTLDDTQVNGTVDYIYNTELHVAYTNLKGVITNWVQDAGVGGHFTNGVSTLSLGPGNNCPDVVAGLVVVIAGTEYTIDAIADDGTAASAVTLDSAAGSGAVTMIRTTTIVNSGITLSGSDGAWSALATKTLTLEQIADSSSVRQAVLGTELSGDGNITRITWKAYSGTTAGTGGAYTNTGMKILAASIVERSGSTWNGTTTPTAITFNNGAAGAQCAIGGTIVSDPVYYAVDNAKNYLIITDYGTAI